MKGTPVKGTIILEEVSVIALVQAGNTDAFADIVEQYQIPIQRYLYRLTGDYELAKDLTQDTFIQAYKGIMKTNSDISFKAWLYRIATNNAWQHRRRKKLISFVSLEDNLESGNQSDTTQSDCIGDRMAIQEALIKVPREQRICLVLHLVEGFKYKEIAKTLGISEDAVRMRVARGKDAFQKFYKGGEV
jgi:RNA polymerase sigma-70 factor (ECF subfamily)